MSGVRSWSRHAPLAFLGLAAIVLLAAVAVCMRWSDARRDEAAAQDDLRLRLAAAMRAKFPQAPPPDFVQSLPRVVSIDAMVQTLQQSAKDANVLVVDVTSEPKAPTAHSLGRLEVAITLRGSYAGIKSTLGEALARYPDGVVEELRIKRSGTTPGLEEASVQFVLLLRPES